MQPAIAFAILVSDPMATEAKSRNTAWAWLLVLPYIGLCFPQFYNRAEPSLWGFPFFYWYQFAWVLVSSAITWLVYLKSKR